ncbi:hypothetical protein L0Y69_01820 [bacterium]|nr:hypothetical protein [bacterium]
MSKKMKGALWWGIGILIPVALVAWIVSLPKIPEDEVLSRQGVHWHAELAIKIATTSITIPANVGISAASTHPNNMHTHADDNIIHIEKTGIVRKDDARLKHFFEVWEKDFSKDSILGNAATGSSTIKMLVNGVENQDYGEYIMRDGDKIEIIYETKF